MTKPIYIRPSTVGSWQLCPARPGLRGEDGYNYMPNEALLFGSTVHFGIETTIVTGYIPTYMELLAEMGGIFTKDQPDIGRVGLSEVTDARQRMAIVEEARVAVKKWVDDVFPKLPDEQAVVEETIEGQAGSYWDDTFTEGDRVRPIIVRGTPDAVYPEAGLIVDWKTAGRAWSADKHEAQIQPVAYPWMYEETHGVPITDFHFWIWDRAKSWWTVSKTKAGNRDAVRAFREMAMTVATQIEEGLLSYTPSGQGFKSRGWHCSPQYCDAWGICSGKYLVQDGQADQPVLTIRERWS